MLDYSKMTRKYIQLLSSSLPRVDRLAIVPSGFFTTAAMWLRPFWNSFSMSYNGIVAETLVCCANDVRDYLTI